MVAVVGNGVLLVSDCEGVLLGLADSLRLTRRSVAGTFNQSLARRFSGRMRVRRLPGFKFLGAGRGQRSMSTARSQGHAVPDTCCRANTLKS